MRDAGKGFTHGRDTDRGDRSVTAACLMRSGGVWARLEAEWERLAGSVEYREALRVWAGREPAVLGCFDSIDELVRLAESPVLAIADPLWLALLRQAGRGDSVSDPAVRLVAHLMVPRAARLAASMRRAGHVGEEVDQAVVAALLTAIAAFPTRRRRSCVAANLALDMLILAGRDLAPAACMVESPAAPGVMEAALANQHPAYGAGGMAAAEELARVLVWAVRSEVISTAEAQFLADSTRTDDPSDRSNTAGRADGSSSSPDAEGTGAGGRHVSLGSRRRRNHILARLRAAVAEGYDSDRSWPRSDEPVWPEHRRPA